MKKDEKKLTEYEVVVLEHFLLYRSLDESEEIEEDEYDANLDEGLLTLNHLDGFLTALVSGPATVPPSTWISRLWGDKEPIFNDEKEFNLVFALITKHMNHIAEVLVERPERFFPWFEVRETDEKDIVIVDEWCDGYMRAVHINQALWNGHSTAHDAWLDTMNSFTEYGEYSGQDEIKLITGDERAEVVWQAVLNIHQFWLSQRTPQQQPIQEEKIGRNEPCPCGSGKKFKKCCLH